MWSLWEAEELLESGTMMKQLGTVVLEEPLLLGVHLLLQMVAKVALVEIQQVMVVLAAPVVEEEIEGPVETAVLTAAEAEADRPVQTLTVETAVLTEAEAEAADLLALAVPGEPMAEMVVLAVLNLPKLFRPMARFLLMQLRGYFRFCQIPFLMS